MKYSKLMSQTLVFHENFMRKWLAFDTKESGIKESIVFSHKRSSSYVQVFNTQNNFYGGNT